MIIGNSEQENKVLLFFDESGKNNQCLNLIGGLMIPASVFNLSTIKKHNQSLVGDDYSLHWTDYGGDGNKRSIIINIIHDLMIYKDLIDLNVIIYDRIETRSNLDKTTIDDMIYSKFPERIFYGLLRFYEVYTSINAFVYIEEDTTYIKNNLKEKITEILNVQAAYRGENFKITKAQYKSKNEIIGLEMVDLLMGITKSIIENDDRSGKKRAKNDLIVELLKDKNTYDFFSCLKIFKWNDTRSLEHIEFSKLLNLFLNHRDNWLNDLR